MSRQIRCIVASSLVLGILGFSGQVYAQQFVQISVATDGTPGNAASVGGVYSSNGQVVAFSSDATNLVAGDGNGSRDIFVRDLVAHTTTRVSVTSAGIEKSGDSGTEVSLSADGSIVAFASRAALVAEGTNSCTVAGNPPQTVNCRDIYVHNRSNGQTERVSIASDGAQANGDSSDPHLSADGRYVVFASSASNLVGGDQNGVSDVFVHDRIAHTTTRLSVSGTGTEPTAPSYGPRISGDGQIVAFASEATIVSDPDPDSWARTARPAASRSRCRRTAGRRSR